MMWSLQGAFLILICANLGSGLKCHECDSRAGGCSMPLRECTYEYFQSVGLEHMVPPDSRFVCIKAVATGPLREKYVFNNCGPAVAPGAKSTSCRVVMPEQPDASLTWQCLTCDSDGCNNF